MSDPQPAAWSDEALLAAFESSPTHAHRAASTRAVFRSALVSLARSLEAHGGLLGADVGLLAEWVGGGSASYGNAARSFYRWAADEGLFHGDLAALRVPPARRARPRPVTPPVLALVPPGQANPARTKSTTVTERMATYREALQRLEMMPRTIDGYFRAAREADWWCETQGYTLRNVPAIVLAQYVAMRPKTYASRVTLRVALTHYWTAFKRKDPPVWVLTVPRKPKAVCRAMTEEEAVRLSAVAVERGGREAFAVLLGMYQGLRRLEIAQLAWHDFTDDGRLRIMGKGDQPASLPVHPVVAEALGRLDRGDPTWIFPSPLNRGHRRVSHVHPATVWQWVDVLAGEAGLDNVTPHRLRHTCLATANDGTGDLRAVQDFARHSKPETTAGYTRTTERRLRAVLRALDYSPGAADRVEAEQRIATKLAKLPIDALAKVEAVVDIVLRGE